MQPPRQATGDGGEPSEKKSEDRGARRLSLTKLRIPAARGWNGPLRSGRSLRSLGYSEIPEIVEVLSAPFSLGRAPNSAGAARAPLVRRCGGASPRAKKC